MDVKIYPAVFEPQEEGYTVQFHDIPDCITEGDTIEEATMMAQDALGGVFVIKEEEVQDIPPASNPKDITVDNENFVVMVAIDMDAYRKKYGQRAVKKTLTLPAWLNTEAELAHINFSSVLQEALKTKLNL